MLSLNFLLWKLQKKDEINNLKNKTIYYLASKYVSLIGVWRDIDRPTEPASCSVDVVLFF